MVSVHVQLLTKWYMLTRVLGFPSISSLISGFLETRVPSQKDLSAGRFWQGTPVNTIFLMWLASNFVLKLTEISGYLGLLSALVHSR
jgi:hypothetical protein